MLDSLRHRLFEFLKIREKMLPFEVAASTANITHKKWLAIEQGLLRLQSQNKERLFINSEKSPKSQKHIAVSQHDWKIFSA
jgi:hypothetical protein